MTTRRPADGSWSPGWYVTGIALALPGLVLGLVAAGQWRWAAALAVLAGAAVGVAWERFWYARTRAASGSMPAVSPVVSLLGVTSLGMAFLPLAAKGTLMATHMAVVAAVCAARLRRRLRSAS